MILGFPGGWFVAQLVKNPPAMLETWVRSLDWEDPLEKGKATHSNTLAWEISRTEETGRLQFMGSQRSQTQHHCCSVAQLCLTLSDPADCRMLGFLSFPISRSLLKLTSIESMMLSNHLILCHPLFLLPSIFPIVRVFSSESAVHIRWPKYWSFSICPFNEYSGLTLYNWLVWSPCCPRNSQESSPGPQFESISFSVLSLLYGPILTFIHDYWKNHRFNYIDLCQQTHVS